MPDYFNRGIGPDYTYGFEVPMLKEPEEILASKLQKLTPSQLNTLRNPSSGVWENKILGKEAITPQSVTSPAIGGRLPATATGQLLPNSFNYGITGAPTLKQPILPSPPIPSAIPPSAQPASAASPSGGFTDWWKNLGSDKQSALSMGLLTTGLSMMATPPREVPYSEAEIIGRGGLAGIGAYGEAMKTARQQRMEQELFPLQKRTAELGIGAAERKAISESPLTKAEIEGFSKELKVPKKMLEGANRERIVEALLKQREIPPKISDKIAPSPKGYISPTESGTGYVYIDQYTGRITGDAPSPEKMNILRGEGFGVYKPPSSFIDTKNNNQLTTMSNKEFNEANKKEPGRFLGAAESEKVLTQKAAIDEIQKALDDTRWALDKLPKGEWTNEQKVKMAYYMRSDEGKSATTAFLKEKVAESMTPEEIHYITNLYSLKESAMAMRGLLKTGQGSDTLREAIFQTIPGMVQLPKSSQKQQFDSLERMLKRLSRGVPGIKLGGAEIKMPESDKTVTRTGTHNGKKVIQYSDGSIKYAP